VALEPTWSVLGPLSRTGCNVESPPGLRHNAVAPHQPGFTVLSAVDSKATRSPQDSGASVSFPALSVKCADVPKMLTVCVSPRSYTSPEPAVLTGDRNVHHAPHHLQRMLSSTFFDKHVFHP
jgi:outer membrane receptor for Fe3+-dicitrate